jgi:hypothetical protein
MRDIIQLTSVDRYIAWYYLGAGSEYGELYHKISVLDKEDATMAIDFILYALNGYHHGHTRGPRGRIARAVAEGVRRGLKCPDDIDAVY